MDFNELTITGDSDYDILEEEHKVISLNNIFWFKVNKEICQGKLIHINSSDKCFRINFSYFLVSIDLVF